MATFERPRGRKAMALHNTKSARPIERGSARPTQPGGKARLVRDVARVARPTSPAPLEIPLTPPRQSSASLLEKAFTLFGFAVSILLMALFGLDLALAWPLDHASVLFDASSVLAAIILAHLSYDVLRDQRRRGLW
jgi:hypothetical protein